jgi:hypothetical protein
MTNRPQHQNTPTKSICSKRTFGALFTLVSLLATACGHQGASQLANNGKTAQSPLIEAMLDCSGPEGDTTPKGQYGDITIESHKGCTSLYAIDHVIVFSVPNLTPTKIVKFGEQGTSLDDAVWLSKDDPTHAWVSKDLSVVHVGTTQQGRDRFVLRKRHVGYGNPVWVLRVLQGATLQEVQYQ